MAQFISFCYLCIVLVSSVKLVRAQEDVSCYGPGSIAASVLLTILFTVILMVVLYFLWKKYKRQRKEHLILETDAEKGKSEFAFDNPGFKDAGFTPINKPETGKKWNQWSPLSAFTTKSEKKKPLDDSAIDGNEVKVVALRSHDFTGLGFNICGNMKDGIYIKDVLHRGPASESGKLNSGDRINSVTISFEHMVYEDALTILSYASPYEIIIEAKGGRIIHQSGGQGAQPSHPIYKSSSYTDLLQGEKTAKKRLFIENVSNSSYSSLQKSRSNMTTLERKESKSPTNQLNVSSKGQLNPEQLKIQLEQKILSDHQNNLKNKDKCTKIEEETQKTESKFQKFGIRVLPLEQRKIQKNFELSQNDNNINIEKNQGIDEVDKKVAPQAKKREKKQVETPNKKEENFIRQNSVNGSGIKRDKDGIPQEIPNYMMNAAVVAKTNRKNNDEKILKDEIFKKKGKAPAPPEPQKNNFDEIQSVSEDVDFTCKEEEKSLQEEIDVELRNKESQKDYNSDSDTEVDNQSSVNTIELNSSDITIHHAKENEDKQNRKTASTGDLTKIQKRQNTGTLERAQSLDITDSSIPTLQKKKIEDEEDLFGKEIISKEPRLSLILDGLNTFQRNRLKKSTEWGNLEDAILKLNDDDSSISEENTEFDAVVHKVNEIKRESETSDIVKPERKVKNQIWPTDFEEKTIFNGIPKINCETVKVNNVEKIQTEIELDLTEATYEEEVVENLNESKMKKKSQNNIWPIPENSYEKRQQKPLVTEQTLPPEDDLPKYESVIDDRMVEIKDLETVPEHNTNKSDETKTSSTNKSHSYILDATKNFIFTEIASNNRNEYYTYKIKEDTNISDDIKVSRHSLGSLERPKSDDAKSLLNNISNVTIRSEVSEVTNNDLTSIENDAIVTVNTYDPNTSLTLEIPGVDVTEKNEVNVDDVKKVKTVELKQQTFTYVTEIQVTPNNDSRNISEIEIIPNNKNADDSEFEDYLKKFESNEKFIEKFDNSEEPKSLITQTIDAEKELHKIQEIAEEQLKKLPEMRFTTSSYELRTPEKRQSQIELLRSNFEKSPKSPKIDVTKSRIPIATTKTPPTSPERRDSRNLDPEHDKAILELMSTPPKSQIKPPSNKNVTVTSIRTNSKIPSGLPVLSGGARPPIPPRRPESTDENMVHVSTNGVESNFKQWVFNPDNNSVTNIVVTEGKQQK